MVSNQRTRRCPRSVHGATTGHGAGKTPALATGGGDSRTVWRQIEGVSMRSTLVSAFRDHGATGFTLARKEKAKRRSLPCRARRR